MAAQEHHHQQEKEEEEIHGTKTQEDLHFTELLSTYLGLSFTIFLGFLPKNSIPLISTYQTQNNALSFKLMQAEEQLKQFHTRRKEDSKANARVVEIFASHRHAWQQEEKRLLQQIDDCSEEIAFLKSKVEDFEGVEADFKASIEDLKREVSEREEMLSFMSRSNYESGGECYGDMGLNYGGGKAGVSKGVVDECFNGGGVDEMPVYGQSHSGLTSDFLNSTASKFWSDKASLWQDMQQYEPAESVYHAKHFVSRRESPWKVDGDSNGVLSKLKLLEQELLNLERVCRADFSKTPSPMRKQAKRYQALAGKIDDLCRRMQASDPCEATLSSEFRIQRQTEFLLEAFRLQQQASETSQKLTTLQSERGKSYHGGGGRGEVEGTANVSTRRALDSIRNNFKEIQRNLEIWLARIIGELEGLLSRDGAQEYYASRYPFVHQ
ncbi:hypothetical protein AAHA92_00748 [Salvia divinorum]|uniref:Uncharacterized protein n=1 Tax=Salvia divinorum TaxID=28513 RepID=A0ABD1IKL6_SALDI